MNHTEQEKCQGVADYWLTNHRESLVFGGSGLRDFPKPELLLCWGFVRCFKHRPQIFLLMSMERQDAWLADLGLPSAVV